MMQTEQVSLTETLTEERVRRVGEKIAGLPTGDEFKRAVEDDLWREFTGMEDPPEESIEWGELPDESKSIFGYVDEEEEAVPWWLESFGWVASSRGEKIEDLGDSLSNLENFDRTATDIHKPELSENGIVTVLDNFEELADAINDNVGVETERDNSLPSDVLVIVDGNVETTDGFVDWFKGLLELCPPFNEELTSLVMVNSNMKVESVEGLVPEELMKNLKRVGVVQEKANDRVFYERYHKPIVKILKEGAGVFDINLPLKNESLELLFYKKWADSYEGVYKRATKWLEKASNESPNTLSKGDEPHFGKHSFELPLTGTLYSYSSLQIVYITMGVTKNKGDYLYGENWKKVNEIMRSAGLLGE